MTTFTITPGEAKSFPVGCKKPGGAGSPAYGATDSLSCDVYQVPAGSSTGVLAFSPAVSWWTEPDDVTGAPTQTGYDQAEVAPFVDAAQSALLTPGLPTTVVVWRKRSADPLNPERIARFRLVVENPYLST